MNEFDTRGALSDFASIIRAASEGRVQEIAVVTAQMSADEARLALVATAGQYVHLLKAVSELTGKPVAEMVAETVDKVQAEQ